MERSTLINFSSRKLYINNWMYWWSRKNALKHIFIKKIICIYKHISHLHCTIASSSTMSSIRIQWVGSDNSSIIVPHFQIDIFWFKFFRILLASGAIQNSSAYLQSIPKNVLSKFHCKPGKNFFITSVTRIIMKATVKMSPRLSVVNGLVSKIDCMKGM